MDLLLFECPQLINNVVALTLLISTVVRKSVPEMVVFPTSPHLELVLSLGVLQKVS